MARMTNYFFTVAFSLILLISAVGSDHINNFRSSHQHRSVLADDDGIKKTKPTQRPTPAVKVSPTEEPTRDTVDPDPEVVIDSDTGTAALELDGNYLYNLKMDATETTNLYNDETMQDILGDLQGRRLKWADKVKQPEVPTTTDKASTWIKAGGTMPWVDTDFEPVDSRDELYSYEDAPHIVFIFVDDWGYNDVGFRSTYLNWTTPTIDRLADEGVKLSNYFTHFSCMPSRGALLTGRYALRLGLWDFGAKEEAELSLEETTLAQELQTAGYRTYMVGKWHLGCSTKAHFPTWRGFNSFYGFMLGSIDYWTKENGHYLDLHDGMELVDDPDELSSKLHNGYLLQRRAEGMIEQHATKYPDKPMFLYYSLQLVHGVWSAPEEFLQRCSYPKAASLQDDYLQDVDYNYCALNVMLDEVVANTTCKLAEYNMTDNTIMMIVSDNGGIGTISGNNYPYRGEKGTNFRGGLSTTAIIHGKLVSEEMRGQTWHGQMHVTDWYPTLMGLATGNSWNGSFTGATLDGRDVWHAIMSDDSSPHDEIIHYHDGQNASIQYDFYKLDYGADLVDFLVPAYTFDKDQDPDAASTSCTNPSLMYDDSYYEGKSLEMSPVGHIKSEVVGAGVAALLGLMAIIVSATMFSIQMKRKDGDDSPINDCDDDLLQQQHAVPLHLDMDKSDIVGDYAEIDRLIQHPDYGSTALRLSDPSHHTAQYGGVGGYISSSFSDHEEVYR